MKDLLSIEKACEVLDISDTTLYKLMNINNPSKAIIKSFTIGRHRKISRHEIDKFISESTENGGFEIYES